MAGHHSMISEFWLGLAQSPSWAGEEASSLRRGGGLRAAQRAPVSAGGSTLARDALRSSACVWCDCAAFLSVRAALCCRVVCPCARLRRVCST
eukprot:4166095-Prymnesium_polylepis.1